MGTLKTFFYCESTVIEPQLNGDAKMIVRQPFFHIMFDFVPTMFTFSVGIGLEGVNDNDLANVVVRMKDTGEIIADAGSLALSLLKPVDSRVMIAVQFQNVKFNVEGEYETEVYLNGEVIGRVPIAVRRRAR